VKSVVAIVGRPNVGKSTLFNRLCHGRRAIVDPQAGVTRDRKYEEVVWNGRSFIVVDTGGIIPQSADTIDQAVRFQAEVSIEESDFILFVVDAQSGVTDMDEQIARILGPHREKVMLVANKVDNEKNAMELYDFLRLGFNDAFPVSAAHGRNTGNFLDALLRQIKTAPHDDETVVVDDALRVAIVGKPNVGKSSLVNRLTGEEAVIVSEIPGTTRDSIDTRMRYHGRDIVLVDTAGLKRKKRIAKGVDFFASMRTIESINRASLVLLIIDAGEPVSNQDKKIAEYAHRNYKDIIVVFNKWDLPQKDSKTTKRFTDEFRYEMPFLEHAPVAFVSALTGQRVRKLLDIIIEVDAESRKRIPTAKLNAFLRQSLEKYSPTHATGKHVKIYYVTQAQAHPPVFVFFCNDPKLVTKQYRRYLHNRLRDEFGFEGVGMIMRFRGREGYDENGD